MQMPTTQLTEQPLLLLVLLYLLLLVTSSSSKSVGESTRWVIVVDAGSTSSKVKVYQMKQVTGTLTGYEMMSVISKTFRTPLAHSNPKEAENYTAGILDWCQTQVPKQIIRQTIFTIGATAGFRFLTPSQVAQHMYYIKRAFDKYQFQSWPRSHPLRVLTGTDEAKFTWLSVNYLLRDREKLSTDKGLATLEMGGGSMQIAHKINSITNRVTDISYYQNGNELLLRAISYLGLGQEAAILRLATKVNDTFYTTKCMDPKSSVSFVFMGENMTIKGDPINSAERPDFCYKRSKQVVQESKVASENGVGKEVIGLSAIYYIISYLHDKYSNPNSSDTPQIIKQSISCNGKQGPLSGKCESYTITVGNLTLAAKKMTLNPVGTKNALYYFKMYSMTLSILNYTLTEAMGLSNDTNIRVVRDNDHNTFGWTLGYGLGLLNDIDQQKLDGCVSAAHSVMIFSNGSYTGLLMQQLLLLFVLLAGNEAVGHISM